MFSLLAPFGKIEAETLEELNCCAKAAEKEHAEATRRRNSAAVRAVDLAKVDAYYLLRAVICGDTLPGYDRLAVSVLDNPTSPGASCYVIRKRDAIDTLYADTRHGGGIIELHDNRAEFYLLDNAGHVRGLFLVDTWASKPEPRLYVPAAVETVLQWVDVPGIKPEQFNLCNY
jgi:hypothetical protein